MIISNKQVQNLLKIYNKDLRNNTINKTEAVKGKSMGKDELALSGESRIKQKALQTARQADVYDQERVDLLREQISSGTYTVTDDEVADKMIARAIVDHLV